MSTTQGGIALNITSTASSFISDNTNYNIDIDSGELTKMASREEYTSRAVGSYLLLFSLVFGIAASVNKRSLQTQIVNKAAWLTAIFIQFVILPSLGLCVARALELNFACGITLLLITTSPGGTYSNWFCSIFNGDVGLSVIMTLISTILGIIMIPCNLILYASNIYHNDMIDSIHWGNIFSSIFVVITAALGGIFFSAKLDSSHFHKVAYTMAHVSGACVVLFTILIIIYADDTKVTLVGKSWRFYVGVASPCVAGFVLATAFAMVFEMPKPERVTVTIECFYQNISIATALAIAMFEGQNLSDALVIPLYYGIVQAVIVILYFLVAWKLGWTKAPKDENICAVIAKPYEILEFEAHETKRGPTVSNTDINNLTVISNAQVVNVVDEFVDNAFVEVDLQTSSSPVFVKTPTKKDEKPDVYVDDGSVKKQRMKFMFRNKSKVMDAPAPTISPTSVLSPSAFEQTTNNAPSFKRKKKVRTRKSSAVKQLFIEETINEDSLAEDPDISIAGESDLESGLSVSVYGDEVSLSGFSLNRPTSRASLRIKKEGNLPPSSTPATLEEDKNPSVEDGAEVTPTKSNVVAVSEVTDIEQGIAKLPLDSVDVDKGATEEFDEISLMEKEDTAANAEESFKASSSDVEMCTEEIKNYELESMSKDLDSTSAQVIVEEIAAIEVSQNDGGAGSPSEQHYVEELVDKTKNAEHEQERSTSTKDTHSNTSESEGDPLTEGSDNVAQSSPSI